MIQIISDWDAVEREIDRLERAPSQRTRQVLRGIIETGFALTQEAVHSESGALAASGQVSTDYDRVDHAWSGEITYGDDNGPVDYAIYEQRRGVHWVGPSDVKGDHDFMRPLTALHPMFVQAILMELGK